MVQFKRILMVAPLRESRLWLSVIGGGMVIHIFYFEGPYIKIPGSEEETPSKTAEGRRQVILIETTPKQMYHRYPWSHAKVRDYRTDWTLQVNEPVAGNYYPVNLGMLINDEEKEVSILIDRAVGGTSLENGQLELMLHRRLLNDDGRGVGEALNEVVCLGSNCEGLTVQGKFYVNVAHANEGSRWRRSTGQEIYSPLQLAFTTQGEGENWIASQIPVFSAMAAGYNLPENVALITLQELEDGSILLRLAHLYEVDEDKELASMARVDLKQLFANRQISNITELNLSANQEKSAMKPGLKWKISATTDNQIQRGATLDPHKLEVELGPMEIRTFSLYFS